MDRRRTRPSVPNHLCSEHIPTYEYKSSNSWVRINNKFETLDLFWAHSFLLEFLIDNASIFPWLRTKRCASGICVHAAAWTRWHRQRCLDRDKARQWRPFVSIHPDDCWSLAMRIARVCCMTSAAIDRYNVSSRMRPTYGELAEASFFLYCSYSSAWALFWINFVFEFFFHSQIDSILAIRILFADRRLRQQTGLDRFAGRSDDAIAIGGGGPACGQSHIGPMASNGFLLLVNIGW